MQNALNLLYLYGLSTCKTLDRRLQIWQVTAGRSRENRALSWLGNLPALTWSREFQTTKTYKNYVYQILSIYIHHIISYTWTVVITEVKIHQEFVVAETMKIDSPWGSQCFTMINVTAFQKAQNAQVGQNMHQKTPFKMSPSNTFRIATKPFSSNEFCQSSLVSYSVGTWAWQTLCAGFRVFVVVCLQLGAELALQHSSFKLRESLSQQDCNIFLAWPSPCDCWRGPIAIKWWLLRRC